MKVVVIDRYGAAEVLHLAEAEDPVTATAQLRIRVTAAAVNPADYKWRQGMFEGVAPLSFPHVLGYDVAGVVDRVGDAVGGFSVGERIVGMLDPRYKGGYAELALLPPDSVAKVPGTLDLGVAAAIPTAGLTGVQLIEEHIRPRAGSRVLITGACGAVGRFAVYAARLLGVRVIAGVREEQRELALELGAEDIAVLGKEWKGAPFDHVADTVGGPEVSALCRSTAAGGRIRTVATTPLDADSLPTTPEFVAVHPDAKRLQELVEAVAAGRIEVKVARRLSLSEAAEAHRLVERGGLGGKIILQP